MTEKRWYERTDICEHGHEYRLCADCQAEDYVMEMNRMLDEEKKTK